MSQDNGEENYYFLKVKLRLKVDIEKSAIDIFSKGKLMGINLYHYHKGVRFCLASKFLKRCEMKIREISLRSNGQKMIK